MNSSFNFLTPKNLFIFVLYCCFVSIQVKPEVSITAGPTSVNKSRISTVLGGHRSPARLFYVQVTQQTPSADRKLMCGGTIIHEEWVLTAAHCVSHIHPNDIAVRTGDFTGEDSEKTEVLVEQIFWYADFTVNKHRLFNDIALIKVYNHTFPGDHVLPICLEIVSDCPIFGFCGTGYARLNERTLSGQMKEILLYQRRAGCCWDYSVKCRADLVCTRRLGAFRDDNIYFGDSGGPLFMFGEFPENKPQCVYGVASFFRRCERRFGNVPLINCFLGGSYFASVPYFAEWIERIVYSYYVEIGLLPEEQNDFDTLVEY